WLLRVTAASGRPDGSAVSSVWRAADGSQITLQIDARRRTYAILAPADAVGNLRLTFETPRLIAPSDPRTLGLPIFRIVATPAQPAPYRPAWTTLAWTTAALAGVYVLARRTCAPFRRAANVPIAVVAAVALIVAWTIATRRMDATIFVPTVAVWVWAAYALTPFVEMALRTVQPVEDTATAAGLTAVAWFVRVAGMIHPYALTSDLGLHVNNLADVARGAILFTEGLPCRAGAGPQPYPPGGYLALLPVVLLTGADRAALTLLVQAGTALLESLTVAVLWLLIRRAGAGTTATLYAAAIYALAPPILRSYSVGEMANLLAQALVAPLILWMTLALRNQSWKMMLSGAALFLLILLSHGGVALSTGAALAVWLLLGLTQDAQPLPSPSQPPARGGRGEVGEGEKGDEGKKASGRGKYLSRLKNSTLLLSVWRPAVAAGIAGLAAFTLFYSAFGYVAEERRIAQEALAVQGIICPPGDPLLDKLNWWVIGFVFSPGAPVSPIALAASIVGALIAIRSRGRSLSIALAACWLGVIVSLGTLLFSDQPVRWTIFIYPALCIGAGVALEQWQRRGRAGAAIAITTVLFLIWYGAADWVRQVSEYLR
ncbi:MAG: hypothetical protein NZM94_07665, partial [Roseiflexus sp.]|nr:hypothetical protein [Roseiflexus sp.]